MKLKVVMLPEFVTEGAKIKGNIWTASITRTKYLVS